MPSLRHSSLAPLLFEKRSQGDGVVVLRVTRREQKRHRPASGEVSERPPRVRFGAEFGGVALLKFVPLGRVVGEPLPQRVARGDIPKPAVEAGVFLAQSTRPEPIDQEAGAVGRRGRRFIDTFEPYHLRFAIYDLRGGEAG